MLALQVSRHVHDVRQDLVLSCRGTRVRILDLGLRLLVAGACAAVLGRADGQAGHRHRLVALARF